MNWIQTLVGALVEAWGEVKVQRARVILSLVGVTAAVAAMATVIALGNLSQQSAKESIESWTGRDATLRLTPQQTDTGGDTGPMMGGGVMYGSDGSISYYGQAMGPAETDASEEGSTWSAEATGIPKDPVSQAMITVAQRFAIPYWSRMEQSQVQLKETQELKTSGTFHGAPAPAPDPMTGGDFYDPQITAVDPAYQTLFRLEPMQGRWLRSGDVNQRVLPVVINQALWTQYGSPNIYEPVVLEVAGHDAQRMRVVGVVPSQKYDQPTIFAPYDGWQLMKPSDGGGGAMPATMMVWSSPEQLEEARTVLPAALKSVLGPGWDVMLDDSMMMTGGGGGDDSMMGMQMTTMAVGGIVIFLGALGLLNVAIVTVKQRIREIGIRRALGASASRVFVSVFLESVVATFVAGVVGVALAIIIVRFLPLESMYIFLQDRPSFPMSAAIAGVGIATGIGALCGIIPAFAAVKVKPIDAIRY